MIRATNYAAAAILALTAAAHATGISSDGTSDPVVGYRGHEVDPASIISLDGLGVAGLRNDWANAPGGIVGGDEIPAVPLPGAAWLLLGALGATMLIFKWRRRWKK